MRANLNLKCSPKGILFIKNWEKLSLQSYWDKVGKVFTIGWGHTGSDVYEGRKISLDKAKSLFEKDIKQRSEIYVQQYIDTPLTQSQFDALCSFTFNAGCGSLGESKIRLYVNKGDFEKAYEVWLSHNTRGGQKGLERRRRAEANMFIDSSSQIAKEKVIKEPFKEEKISKSRFMEYIHSGGIYSVEELLNQEFFIVKKGTVTELELLGITFQNKTNHRRLYDNLGIKESYDVSKRYAVTNGARLIIPNSQIEIGMKFDSNFLVSQNQSSLFFPKILKQMSNDPGYATKYKNTKSGYLLNQNSVLSVFGWSRALYLQEDNLGYTNLTKDIVSMTTSNSVSGEGSFIMSLAPIQGKFVENKWEKTGVTNLSSGDQVSQTSLNYIDENGRRKRSNFYYKEIFGQNDLVFISFEELQIESNRESIANNWYDMIGMIDSVQVDTSPNHQISITISGRSLVKVLQTDNSYFNPYSIGHSASIFGKTPVSNGRFLDGRFYNLESILSRSIEDSIRFIFHHISSVDFVPDEIFSGFENLTVVSTFGVRLNSDDTETEDGHELYKNVHKFKEKEVRGIWQIIKLFVDSSVRDLRVVDDSISNPNGSIFDLIKKVSQQPFVEMFTDTYGDKFYIIIRRPPFDQASMLEFLSNFTPEEIESTTYGPEVHSGEGPEILILNDGSEILNSRTIQLSRGSRTLDVTEDMIISENLSYSSEAYSWFHLTDRGNYAGTSVSQGVYQGVYFDEMAQIFGNSRLSIVSNYSNQDFWSDKAEGDRLDKYAKHASELLGWLIETHIYLPFTREGTITIQGDRRFRAGTFLYYEPTKEVFYIKSVTQQLSVGSKIDRVTTLSVQRGMVKSLMYGSERTSSGEELSYFNLVNINKFKESYYKIVSKGTADQKFDYKSSLSLNKEVFDFFLKRKQNSSNNG